MPDVVVTVPRSFGLAQWIDEGDAAGQTWSGEEWDFYLFGKPPVMQPRERVYVVYNGALRGYAPLVRVQLESQYGASARKDSRYGVHYTGLPAYWGRYSLVRHGGARAVTIPEYIQGFRGWRIRWWERSSEVPFPNWQDEWAAIGFTRPRKPAKIEPIAPAGLWE